MKPTIGNNIRNARQRRGWTQEQLASQAGISKSFLSDIEADRYSPSYATLRALSSVLRLDPIIMIGLKQEAVERA